jgi:hypothetical protein
MARYASGTNVSVDRSRTEIERVLRRYGASSFLYGWDEGGAVLAFVAEGWQVRFVVPMPDPHGKEFTRTDTGRPRAQSAAAEAYEAEVRRRWRVLVLALKAKLEVVATGLISFEREFLAHIVLPNGQTVGDASEPAIRQAYRSGQVPELLPGTSSGSQGG